MRKIMISIKPEYVLKILNGEKTIEIRKSIPKGYKPCEVYIYCTKNKPHIGKYYMSKCPLNGKVVAKFTLNCCDTLIYTITMEYHNYDAIDMTTEDICKFSNVTQEQLYDYGKGNDLYTWHIDNLTIFDKPLSLNDFNLKHAPQSWCYVDYD